MHRNLNLSYRLARVSGSNAAKESRSRDAARNGRQHFVRELPCEPPRRCTCNEASAGLATQVARPAESFFVASSPLSVAESAFSKGRHVERGAAQNHTFLSWAIPPSRESAPLAFEPSLSHRAIEPNLSILSYKGLLDNTPCAPSFEARSALYSATAAHFYFYKW